MDLGIRFLQAAGCSQGVLLELCKWLVVSWMLTFKGFDAEVYISSQQDTAKV